MTRKKSENLAANFQDTLRRVKNNVKERRDFLQNAVRQTQETLENTRNMLQEFKTNRKHTAWALKKFLNKYKIDLKKANTARTENFKKFFHGLSQQNNHTARELRTFLKKHHLDLQKGNFERFQNFLGFWKTMQNQVGTLHEAYQQFRQHMDQRRRPMFYAKSASSTMHSRLPSGKKKFQKKTKTNIKT